MPQEPHYECAVTGELLPVTETEEVTVYKIELHGHDRFKKKRVGDVRVNDDYTNSNYFSFDLLVVKGEPVAIYKVDKDYGRSKVMEELDEERVLFWEDVAEAALDSDETDGGAGTYEKPDSAPAEGDNWRRT